MRIGVVGAGIAGLVLARRLRAAGHETTVWESSTRPGGQVRTLALWGCPVDVGAEALHLGKPVLAVPNRGFFEQTVNARALVALGRGVSVVGRAVRAADVAGFLSRAAAYGRRAETPGAERTGREAAGDAVEAALGIPPVALPAPTASRARRNPVHMRRLSWDVLRDNATP